MIKQNSILLASLIFWVFNFSYSQKASQYAILKGKILNGKETIEVVSSYHSNKSGKIINLNEDGSFIDSLLVNKEELYLISDKTNTYQFYLIPSHHYSINYDANKFNTQGVTMGGDDIAINNYFIDKSRGKKFYDLEDDTAKSENEIRAFLNDIKKTQIARLNNSNIPDYLRASEMSSIKFDYLRHLSLYLAINGINNISITSKDELDIDYEDETAYRTNENYKYLVSDYYNVKLRNKIKKIQESLPSYSLFQNAIKETAFLVSNEFIKNDLIADGARVYLLNSEDKETCYEDFKTYYTGNNNDLKMEMFDLYNRLHKLKSGTQSPKFFDFENYEGGTTNLDDFLGKYVFIDIWATWCANCFNEMDALKKLEKEKKEIVFLSIAWKDDENKWKQIIETHSLPGVQLLAPKDDNSFFEAYSVQEIPRYILVNPEGQIVDYSAPRPSDQKLNILFENLNIK